MWILDQSSNILSKLLSGDFLHLVKLLYKPYELLEIKFPILYVAKSTKKLRNSIEFGILKAKC